MGIVLPNGKFYDIVGPFYANGDHNDQWIWNFIVAHNMADIKNIFDTGIDLIILFTKKKKFRTILILPLLKL